MERNAPPKNQERVCTGSVGEKIIVRTTSTRGSMREALTKAIRSTLRRTSTEKSQNLNTSPAVTHRSLSDLKGLCDRKPPRNPLSSNDLMSQSLINQSSCSFCEDCSLHTSPSLSTLKDFSLIDYDDTKSVVSTASTSRICTKDFHPKRYKTHNLRSFLNSPG
ncbi:hypothetical protein Y032_0237g3246 [Ancylostoma ceylanicum]|uniref:Uncharacterized protein n=1 Tax=Ancylostoma ceylanicum TaxID=53326 RepID=A0A016SFA8_9BILA|nr:hypothetical protein Y032_0237g3246 [Ancylostoma ceylanicum]